MVWLVCAVCVSISLLWFVCAVLLVSCLFLLLACVRCVWCVALLCVVSLVCRAYVYCCCCVVFVFVFVCYGLNAFPVCDCIVYVPSLRCSSTVCVMLFVCLCVYVMACVCCLFIEFNGLLCVCYYVMFLSLLFLARVFCVWCVELLFAVSSVCRACVCCCCCSVFVSVFCYGLNDFPVSDCILYVPSWRCSSLCV